MDSRDLYLIAGVGLGVILLSYISRTKVVNKLESPKLPSMGVTSESLQSASETKDERLDEMLPDRRKGRKQKVGDIYRPDRLQ